MDNHHRYFNYNHYPNQHYESIISKGSDNQLLNAFKTEINSHCVENNRQHPQNNRQQHHQRSIINIIIQLIILIIIIERNSPNVQSAAIVLSSPRKNYPLTSKFISNFNH